MATVPRWGAKTHRGQIRELNEDAFLASPPVFLVADGMGGHAAGEIASRIAIEAFEQLAGKPFLEVPEVLALLEHINSSILDTASNDASMDSMGTTLTGLILVRVGGLDHWMVLNIGDSRTYRMSTSEFAQITTDHSEVQELVAAGTLTKEEALSYPHKNVITRALGSLPAPQADTWIFPRNSSERFILCSDGLTNELDDQGILELAATYSDPEELATRLVQAANDAGGRDNITVIVVVVDNDGDPVEGSLGNTLPRKEELSD